VQAREILRNAGLQAGIDYQVIPVGGTFQRIKALKENSLFSASILNPPFSKEARQAGLKSFGRAVNLLDPYQATAAFGLRHWVERKAVIVTDYIATYIAVLRYALNPANRDTAIEFLERKLGIPERTACTTYDLLFKKDFGLDQDAILNLAC
jgi:hypothetical protein